MRTIAIDPGHGGSNMGAMVDGAIEKEQNLIFAQCLQRALISTYTRPGYQPMQVEILRNADFDLSHAQRGQKSADVGATLVLCIHHNGWVNPSGWGTQWYVDGKDPLGTKTAEAMWRAWPARLVKRRYPVIFVGESTKKEDWRRNAWNVIRHHRRHATTVLIEVGFLSSPRDMEALSSSIIRRHIFAAVCCGVGGWLDDIGEAGVSAVL